MSQSQVGRTKRFIRCATTICASLMLAMLFLAPPASAVAMCTYDGVTRTVTIAFAAGDSAVIGVDTSTTPDEIIFDDDTMLSSATQCGTADVTNTDLIDVKGSTGAETFVIDLSDGAFDTADEFEVDLSTGTDTLRINGSSGDDTIVLGTEGIDLDDDNAEDVTDPTPPGIPAGVENFNVNAAGGVDTVNGAGSSGTGSAFTSALTIHGGTGADTLLSGGSAADTINGGTDTGNDTIDCAVGTDTVTYAVVSSAVTVNLVTTTPQNTSGAGTDTITNCENLTGGSGNDTLTGNTSANTISGGSGINSLGGQGGDDVIAGLDGADSIRGGDGDDTTKGGAGDDAVRGGAGNDSLRGGTGNDVLRGRTGNDTIAGGPGTDTCKGGPGADSIRGCQRAELRSARTRRAAPGVITRGRSVRIGDASESDLFATRCGVEQFLRDRVSGLAPGSKAPHPWSGPAPT